MKHCLVFYVFALLLLAGVACNNIPTLLQSPATSTPQSLLPMPADALVIENGTVIVGTGAASIPDGIVAIRGDRIVAVGPRPGFAIPSSAQVINALGGTILPGIINAHAHSTSNAAVRRVSFLLKGVTSVCDMGSPLGQMPEFAQDYKSGPAARGFKSGPIITVPGGYPDVVWHMGFNYEVADSDEARAAVADLVNRGADVIKIALEPGGKGYQWPMLDLAQVQAIVEEAHAHGKLVRAHVGSTKGTDLLSIVLNSGVDSIEHAPVPIFSASEAYALFNAGQPYTMPPTDKDILAQLAAQHRFMVPTLTAYEPLCQSSDLTREQKQECYQFIEGPVRVFHALGGTVALGNDYGAGGAVVGGMPLREMQLLLASGLTPMEVIEASTWNAARVCGHGDELGTLEPGKLADIIIVDGDPLVNIEAMSQVVVVIKAGQIAFPSLP